MAETTRHFRHVNAQTTKNRAAYSIFCWSPAQGETTSRRIDYKSRRFRGGPLIPHAALTRKPGLSADRRRALALLAGSADGCTEAIMLAHSFTLALLVDIIRDGLATGTVERVMADRRAMEISPA